MKTATLICYTLGPGKSQIERNKFRKMLWGYIDHSNSGLYKYKRKGLMSDIPHVKLARAVFIVKHEDANKVIKFMKQFNAIYVTREVILTNDDIKTLYNE